MNKIFLSVTTEMFLPLMWPSSGWWEQEYNYN